MNKKIYTKLVLPTVKAVFFLLHFFYVSIPPKSKIQ